MWLLRHKAGILFTLLTILACHVSKYRLMRMSGRKVRGSPKLQSCIVQVSRVPCQCWRKVRCIKVMYFLLANKKLASACFPRQKACWDFGSRQEKKLCGKHRFKIFTLHIQRKKVGWWQANNNSPHPVSQTA